VTKREVVDTLEEIAVLLELAGENAFKTRAYANAARTLQGLDRDLAELTASGELRELKGIGPALAEKIGTLVATGRLPYLEELRARVPPGLLELLRVPGLGPKRVREVHAKLGIASLAELEYAAESRALQELEGFGEKLQDKILEGIAALKRHADRFLLSDALAMGEEILAAVAALPGARRAAIAGSLRRRCETVGNVDLVAATDDAPALLAAFAALPAVAEVLAPGPAGGSEAAVRLEGGLRVRLRAVPEPDFAGVLRYLTGSREHDEALRAHAAGLGLELDERGLRRGSAPVAAADEDAIFAALGLVAIPPELREGRGEIAAAAAGALPRLLEPGDLRGVLHVHSTYSDGVDTVRGMALAARARGYRYLGVCDHSQSARYAGGMLAADVRRQHEEIDRLNEELGDFRVLKGVECDILADGALDYPAEVLASFELVVGSVHSRFGLGEAEMTQRLLRAVANPFLDVLGHPTGRLLLGRAAYALDLGAVCAAAAERGVAVEINANPHRLDLDWREVRGFQARGGWIGIHPDAHRTEGLDDVRFGVMAARKGWATRDRVLNALSLEELLAWLRARRAR
jgi:DNA polymerase (family 10)